MLRDRRGALVPIPIVLAGVVFAACSDDRSRASEEAKRSVARTEQPTAPGDVNGGGGGPPRPPKTPGVDADAPPPSCASPPPPPAAGAEIDVRIDAGRGPKGHPAPRKVDRRLYGMNIADWEPQNYAPTPRPAFLGYLSALRPGVLRWPAGHRSQEYNWQRGGAGQSGNWTLTPAHVDAFIALARQVGAEPLVAINVKRGTPAAAQDLLRYLNVEHDYKVRWLQIGNEPDLTDGMTSGPARYSEQLAGFVDGLKSVDPAIRIVGPEMLTGAHVGGINGTVDWMTPILANAAGRIDGISWHYYPLDSGQQNPSSSAIMSVEHLFQESAADWPPAAMAFVDEIMPKLEALRTAHAPTAEVWITELAEDPGPRAGEGITETVAGALWVGDILGRYAEYAPGAVLRWLFKGSAMHAYGLLDTGDVPRPAYGAYWLYARHFGDRMVDASTARSEASALTEVAAHAATSDDGRLSVVLVNKKTEPRRVRVLLEGFTACSGETLTLTGAGYGAETFQINGRTLDLAAAEGGIPPIPLDPARPFEIELPPTSMTLVSYRP
jgi:hypothetical protein